MAAERESQAREAALEAERESAGRLQEQYGIDGQQVRQILAIWNQYGSDFDAFLAWWSAERVAGAAAQARVAELEQKLEAYAQLESYANHLEVESNELREENMVLMQQRAAQLEAEAIAKRTPPAGVIAITASASGPDCSTPLPDNGAYSDDTVSIMSYSDSEERTPSSTPSYSHDGPAPRRHQHRRQHTPAVSFGRAGPTGAVAALSAELEKKSGVFDDDAAFIREVHEGVSAAPSMNPEAEIHRLLLRYKVWQKDFKGRLKATQVSLKKFQASPAVSGGHGRVSGTPRVNEGSLTARLMTFARGSRSGGGPGTAR